MRRQLGGDYERVKHDPASHRRGSANAGGRIVVGEAAAGPGDSIERHPFPAGTVFRHTDDHPGVASDADGNFVVVWASLGGFEFDPDEAIWARRFDRDGMAKSVRSSA